MKYPSFSIFKVFNWSALTRVFIFVLFTYVFSNRISEVVKSKEPLCLTAYDGFGYYSYLPAFFIYNDLSFEDWPEKLQEKYCSGSEVYQFYYLPDKSRINIYHLGLAFIELPSFVVGHLIAKTFNYPPDGMSKPYHIAFLLNALVFFALGIYYVRKLLLLFFDDLTTSITLILIFLGTNIFMNFYIEPSLTHLYLFTINAAIGYHTISYQRNSKRKHLLFSSILFGLTTAIRPTQVIWGIIPLFVFLNNHRNFKSSLKILLLYPLFSLLWNIPQLLYWKYFGGSWFMVNLHNESIVLSDPKIVDFLFSFKKGWLLYTPIFLLIPFGIKKALTSEARLTIGITFLTLLSIYIFSSWECWWFAASFGSRVMQEIYPLLAILLGFVISRIQEKSFVKHSLLFLSFSIVSLNIFQSIQFKTGVIDNTRNTKDHYMHHFGIINAENFDQSLLEMDRSDTTWLTTILSSENSLASLKGYTVERISFPVDQLSFSFNENDEYKGDVSKEIMKIIPTDEARITISWDYFSTDSINPALMVFMIENEYNPYKDIYTELKGGSPSNKLIFNLPNIRHSTDRMKLFIWNPNHVSGKLSNVEMKIEYLNRND